MNNSVITQNEADGIKAGLLTKDQVNALAQASVIPHDTPAAVLQVFIATCAAHGLSPFRREIYLVKYGSNYNTIVGIDGLRTKAARTGQSAGRDDVKFDMKPDGSFLTAAQLAATGKQPLTCTVTVYRIVSGVRCPFTKTVLFSEYCPANKSGKWSTMPFNMIEKCAEAAALRMGFADEVAGLNTEEEAAAIQEVTIMAAEKQPALEMSDDEVKARIKACTTIDELSDLYKSDKRFGHFVELFTDRKDEIAPELMLQQK